MTRGLAPPDTLVDGASAKNRPAAAPRDTFTGVGDPPDLVAAIMAEPVRLPGTTCSIIRLEHESPALGAEVRRAMSLNADHGRVFRAFQANGVMLSRQVIAKHMRGDCNSCQRLTS